MTSNTLLLLSSSSPLLLPPLPAKLSILSLPFSKPLQLGSSNISHRQTSRPNKKRFISFSVGVNVSNLLCDVVLISVNPWSPSMEDSRSIIASQLFALSLFPYLGFLYFITKSNTSPKLTLFGFYFLLAFVGATIPAGIYAKVKYGTSLSNVDWLHGSAESLLTLTNLFIVLGLRQSLRKLQELKEDTGSSIKPEQEEEKISV